MSWSDHLCNVRIELLEGPGDDRERLSRAAREFSIALASRHDWPFEMQATAGAIRSLLISRGRVTDTIAAMDETTLRDVSDRLWRFCEVAEPCSWDEAGARVRGLDHLREARAALHEEDGCFRERLARAAQRFWSAFIHADSWPEALRLRAESLSERICRDGRIDESIGRMGDRTAGEVSREMLGICDDAEEVENPPRP